VIPGLTLAQSEPSLTQPEQLELLQHETTIQQGLKSFFEVGKALATIRDKKLYRASHATFEEYCRVRWNIGRRSAYQLIEAAEVMENVRNCAQTLPANEAQARPLTSLPASRQMAAWQRALETAPGGKVSAAHIQQVVNTEFKGVPLPQQSEAVNPTIEPPVAAQLRVSEPAVAPRYAPPSLFLQSQPMQLLASARRDNWRTPPRYLEAARAVLGEIDLDPASSEVANQTVKATRYFTREDDGLSQPWQGRVFCNPPYGKSANQSNQGLFAAKLVAEYEAGRVRAAILLVNLYYGYEWFAPLRERPMCLVDHRICFIDPATSEEGDEAKASSAFIYFGSECRQFFKVFCQFGYCCQPSNDY
jgi:hypothetical protein